MSRLTSDNARTCGDGMDNDTIVSVAKPTTASNAMLPDEVVINDPSPSSSTSYITQSPPLPKAGSNRSASVHHHPSTISNNLSTKIPGEHLIYRHGDQPNRSLPAVVPQGTIFNLIPRLVPSTKSSTFSVEGRNRKPKFIPFEPYKAAISPLVAVTRPPAAAMLHKTDATTAHSSRNNLDLNTLVQHISNTIKTTAGSRPDEPAAARGDSTELEQLKERYERQLADARKDRDQLAAQLKSQVQVNTELKHLLVAAVGEDLQTRVNHLTEDKLHLARALLNSADNLSSHTEQVEYLASQSEVWRSKFLASSLMVEELARWKASLSARNRLLTDASRQLLQTVATVRDMGVETLANLQFVVQQQQRLPKMPSSNVQDVAAECLNITQGLVLHAGVGGMPQPIQLNGLDSTTAAEKMALQALATTDEQLIQTEDAFRAIIGQAFPVNGKAHPSLPTVVDEDN